MPDEHLFDALRFEQILNTIPSGLFLVDGERRIIFWNAEAERITGYSRQETMGRHCSFLEGIECGAQCTLFSDQSPKPISGSFCRIRKKDGRITTIAKNVDYLRNRQGEIVGGVESFVDVSRQVQLEESLRRQARRLEQTVLRRTEELDAERERLRTVLDAMTDPAYITTADYHVVFMNRAMTEVLGNRVGDICYETQGEAGICPECPLGQVLAGETVREERRIGASGRIYEIMHTPLRNGDGTVQKLSVYRDVTDRKEAEDRLKEANRDLDAFVYTVSHDLRTPLTPILGYAEFLGEHYGDRLDERGRRILEEIGQQGERMLALMEDLLELARVGKVEKTLPLLDTGEVVRKLLHEMAAELAASGGRVEVASLPPLSMSESLAALVFRNLIGNALRYAGEKPLVEVGGSHEGATLSFFVRDDGPGIPPAEREQVFELFYRGSTGDSRRGTGLGLAIVRKIIRLYGGRVWAEETPGGGCTFRIELPADSVG